MIALYIIAAHMAGDYLFQTGNMAAKKLTDWRVRAQHCAIYTLCFYPVIFAAGVADEWRGIAFILSLFTTHYIIDSHRWRTSSPWPALPILHDQSLHAVQLAILGGLFLT